MIRISHRLTPLLAIILLTAVGCVRTIQPVLQDNQVITDNSVVGKWISTDGKTKLEVQAPAGDDKDYKVLYTDDKDKTGNFLVRLGKIDNLLIAEIRPAEPQWDASDAYKGQLLPLYTFLVIHQTTPQLVVSSLSIDWLKKYLAKNPDDLKTTAVGNDDFVISASTDDFQAFFLKHYKDEGAMGEKATFERPKP